MKRKTSLRRSLLKVQRGASEVLRSRIEDGAWHHVGVVAHGGVSLEFVPGGRAILLAALQLSLSRFAVCIIASAPGLVYSFGRDSECGQ